MSLFFFFLAASLAARYRSDRNLALYLPRPHERYVLFLVSFGGKILAITTCARRQPNHVKHLLSGLYNLLKENFHLLRLPPGDPRVARSSHLGPNFASDLCFFLFTGISARGPQGRVQGDVFVHTYVHAVHTPVQKHTRH